MAAGNTLEPVQDLFAAALECNRDEWMLRVRRMGSCPCKQPGRAIARFHSNPKGKCLFGRSAALRRLPIAKLLAAPRSLHPIPKRDLRGFKKILNRFFQRLTSDVLRAAAQSTAAQHIPLAEANHHEPGTALWAQFNEAYAAGTGQEGA